jgi:hypothetical protein
VKAEKADRQFYQLERNIAGMAMRVLAPPPVSISPAPLTARPASFNSVTGEVAARLTEIPSIKCSSTPALAGIAGPGRTGFLLRGVIHEQKLRLPLSVLG